MPTSDTEGDVQLTTPLRSMQERVEPGGIKDADAFFTRPGVGRQHKMAATASFPYSPAGDLTSTPPTSYESANHHQQQPHVKQQQQQQNGSAESRYPSPPLGSSSPPQIQQSSITTAPSPIPARAPPSFNAQASAAPAPTTRSRPAYDASLVIPPFNPNKRRSTGANSTATSSTSLETASCSSAGTVNPPSQQAHPQQQHLVPDMTDPRIAQVQQRFLHAASQPMTTQQRADLQLQYQQVMRTLAIQQQQQAVAGASAPAHATLPQRPVSFMPGYPSSSAAATATGQHAYLSASVGPGATAPSSMQFQQQQQPYVQPGQEATMAASVGPGGSVSSRSRQSVGYLPSSSSTASLAGQGPYPHLYTPHPMPRQKVYFGPYILLQTLGEGEFGKVKLGVHSERWGEDVAIKLIKRGNVDTVQRGEKVRREIEVLKMVRHPNIVRLYDVIETEKYIGIVLEYASGGELFDHILAHRYLKERDASRLFAQLISGVSYLHAKGVVHRDLKLENLLLDRNRNVIITDFGFANRFRDERVDLMATSCGSPCYAAPELVVQDGKYIGTAVDVWSCGVILYAMLAGYLPYDDDPNNPEGDNINLLYKYILNTPLVFPEWISEEPRHLLLMMLVADPEQRCTIRDVTQHPWLSRYAPAFDKSVEELEFAAQEMERHKRQALEVQRQWLVQQQQQQLLAAQGLLAPSMTRSQTSASSMGAMGGAMAPLASGSVVPAGTAMAPTTSQQRHRSAMVTSASSATVSAPLPQHGFEPFAPSPPIKETPQLPSNEDSARPAEEQQQPRSRTGSNTSVSSASRRPVPIPSSANSKRRSGQYSVPSSPPTTQTEFVAAQALPFSYEPATTVPPSTATPSSVPMIPSRSAPAAAPPTAEAEDADMLDRGTSASASATPLRQPSAVELEEEAATAASLAAATRRRKAANRATVQLEYDGGAIAVRRRGASREPSLPTSIEGTATEDRLEVPNPERAPPSPDPSLGGVSISTTTETAPGEDVIMESVEEVPEPTVTLPPPVAAEQPAAVAPVAASVPFPSASPAPPPVATPMPNQTVAALSPHSSSAARKRKSSGSPVSSLHTEKPLPSSRAHENENVPTLKTSTGTQASQSTNVDSVPSATSRHRPTMSSDRFSIRSLLNGHAGPSDRAGRNPARVEATGTVAPPAVPSSDGPLDDVSNRRRSTRRQKALSLQPFRSSVNSKLPKQARANVEAAIAASRDRPSIDTAEAAAPTQPPPSTSDKRFNTDLEANWQQQASPANPTPSGKAKAVMDWFRRRSTRHDTSALAPPIAADSQRRERPLSSVYESTTSTTSTRSRMSTPVIVAPKERPQQATAVNESTPPLTPAQTASNSSASAPSAAPVQSSQVARQDVPPISTRASSQPAAPAASAFSPAKLRFHQGALDKNAVTYRSPDEVFAEVKQVLWNMGVEMVLEGDYKIKCIRKSRKKALAASVNHGNFASMASPVNRRASVASTHSLSQSPSMGFRSLFGKKHAPSPLSTPSLNTASVFSTPTTPGSPAAQDQTDPLSSPMTTSVSQFSMLSLSSPQPMPVYGSDKSADAGDEVRFVVELTRVKNLDRLYCVDLKRMKGGPWSFKHVYDQLLDSLELGPVV